MPLTWSSMGITHVQQPIGIELLITININIYFVASEVAIDHQSPLQCLAVVLA